MTSEPHWSRVYGGRVQHWWTPDGDDYWKSACGQLRFYKALSAGAALPCAVCVKAKARAASSSGESP